MATTKKTATTDSGYEGFTAEERDAMKQRAKELKASTKRGGAKTDPEPEVLAKIAEMPEDDRVIAERVHALIKENVPDITPRLWYGMPAYARDGKILCHFQPAPKFKTRYPTLTFSDQAALDDGHVWPVSFAITRLDKADEARLAELIKRSVA